MALFDDLPARLEGRRIWYGVIAEDITDLEQRVTFVIPEFDSRKRWGPARWQARGDIAMPSRDDVCLVAFDNRLEPWVIAWWPFQDE
jgi:hypothetical protein